MIDIKEHEELSKPNRSCAHMMAQTVKCLYPQAKFWVEPVTSRDFYYDINLDDEVIKEEDLVEIGKEMKKITKNGKRIVRKGISEKGALGMFQNDPYKIDLISNLKDGTITCYQQGGFIDLCRGPHVGIAKQSKDFKLLKRSGTYWKEDANNKMLRRIYGICFPTAEELEDYLYPSEEVKRRDRKKLGRELELSMMSEFAPGIPFFLPNGMIIHNLLKGFWYEEHTKGNYQFIKTPIMMSKELWGASGHWENYRESMYTTMVDDHEFVIKPVNYLGSLLVSKNGLHSHKDLPLRMGELGQVHRREASGALNGLFYVRMFTQDNAYIFVRPDQIEGEVMQLIQFIDRVYSVFGLSYHIELPTRPEKECIGGLAIWEQSEKALADACVHVGKDYKVNPRNGAPYGPGLDFHVEGSLGREWQCDTTQLDMNLLERFDLTYAEKDGSRVHPVALHRVIPDSIERFISILIEHFVGHFPVWLVPQQVGVVPVRHKKCLGHANRIHEKLCALGSCNKLDARNEKLGYRIYEAQLSKVPYQLVIGNGEIENRSVILHHTQSRESIVMSLSDFITMMEETVKEKKL